MKNRILVLYALRQFFPIFFIALSFFALIIELVDIFANLTRYNEQQVPFLTVLTIQLYYLPTCLNYGLPIAVIFAASYTLGNFYTHNELIAAFSSGVSLVSFVSPILIFCMILSVVNFFFTEDVVIPSSKAHSDLSQSSMGGPSSQSNPNVVLFDKGTSIVYRASQYQYISNAAEQHNLRDLTVVFRSEGGVVSRIAWAESAVWTGSMWKLRNVQLYDFLRSTNENEMSEYTLSMMETLENPELDLEPKAFRRLSEKVEEMKAPDALDWIESLKSSGLPYKSTLLKYHERYSFAATPFVVALISCAIGSRFRKNIMLKSLLVSLLIAVLYYVIQLLADLSIQRLTLPPGEFWINFAVIGIAWSGIALFLAVGSFLFTRART